MNEKLSREIKVRKNTGELLPYEPEKLREALRRSGAGESNIEKVSRHVESELYDGITTKKIYQIAYNQLRKVSHRSAGRYKLKKAIFQLGPSGYPFEYFVARLLEKEGYRVKTGQVIQGKCVQHEVDVVAEMQGKILMAECKFHHAAHVKSDVKTSLYVKARFDDIRDRLGKDTSPVALQFTPMLITNTRFTMDAEKYGECSGLKLMAWDHPQGNSLKDWIDRSGLHPLTVLKSITKKELKTLMKEGVVLCREIIEQPASLDLLDLTQRRKNSIIKEARALSENQD
ncbi:MAG: restriction endonuclease [Bacteroidales bacterium]|nr:restriction endonuclease [Bacteroidales bacterium]MCF8386408.1 restriction endonuclease [Bacteroidales bacterium]MCF8397898.1 restriction endonuclease [Bacteroidales bacterium]